MVAVAIPTTGEAKCSGQDHPCDSSPASSAHSPWRCSSESPISWTRRVTWWRTQPARSFPRQRLRRRMRPSIRREVLTISGSVHRWGSKITSTASTSTATMRRLLNSVSKGRRSIFSIIINVTSRCTKPSI